MSVFLNSRCHDFVFGDLISVDGWSFKDARFIYLCEYSKTGHHYHWALCVVSSTAIFKHGMMYDLNEWSVSPVARFSDAITS